MGAEHAHLYPQDSVASFSFRNPYPYKEYPETGK